jgi:AbrB family looped-hinge helix DNA binding protein
MATTRLSTKGRLVLPKDVRERQGWEAGTVLEVVERGDAVLIRPVGTAPEARLEEIVGCTGYGGPGRTVEEMDEAIEREALRRR